MLTVKALKDLKSNIRKVCDIYESIEKEWNTGATHGCNTTYPIMVVASVLIHNMAFDYNYDGDAAHEDAVKELYSKLEVLKKLNEYNNKCYTTDFPYTEISMLVQAAEYFNGEEHIEEEG
jgi:hypothetical protein